MAFNPILRKLTNYNLKKLGDGVKIQKDDEKMGKNCNYYVFAMTVHSTTKLSDNILLYSQHPPCKTKRTANQGNHYGRIN